MKELNENQKKWIAALRSGQFKQTDGLLHDVKKDAYCCLGVLCEVAISNGVSVLKESDDNKELELVSRHATRYDDAITNPSANVSGFVGLSFEGSYEAIRLNDIEGKTFTEIADIIETDPDRFFVNTAVV